MRAAACVTRDECRQSCTGAHEEPRAITLNHQKLMTLVDNEKFYSSIINLKVGDKKQAAIVKDLQMHPARNAIVHVDLQRVVETEKIRIHIPIHFKGEAASPGVKSQGGVVSHRIADVEISCLPKDLPEFIELDLSQMEMNESKHLSDLPLPEGVTIPCDRQGRRRGRHRSIRRVRKSRNRPPKSLPRRLPKALLLLRPKVRPRRRREGWRCQGCGDAKGAAAAAPAKKEGGKK